MKNVLVLGGTGAMGTYLVDILADMGNWKISVTSRSVRESHRPEVSFIQGNARDLTFLTHVLKTRWDAIVDFMNWGYQEFLDAHKMLLNACDHYVFLSSSRVYANSNGPLIEESPRLLDVTTDQEFLATQRYALRKARQENMLKEATERNFTIIRPYITYAPERLQLGVYEKEQWLSRVLRGKDIVIRKEILCSQTTMTFAKDVSWVIAQLVDRGLGGNETYQIASSETMTWGEILKFYFDVFQRSSKIKKVPSIYTYLDAPQIDALFEGGYQVKYDRLWNRSFDSQKIKTVMGQNIPYIPMKEGLTYCLSQFLKNPRFLDINEEFDFLCDDLLQNNLVELYDCK